MSAAGAIRAAGAAGRALPPPPHGLPRLIPPGAPLHLGEHIGRYGPVPFRDTGGRGDRHRSADLISEAERAGLAGRGGAGFPTGRKMRTVAEHGRRTGGLRGQAGTVVVANGAESEPASAKDRLLLTRAPHLVLDGIALAAEAVGATRGYLSVHEGQDELALQLTAMIGERDRYDQNRVPIQVVAVPRGYVASQETALISHLNGGAAKPAFVPPRPFQKGAHGRPTLVQNVETLAHLALIGRFGADWFRALGPAHAPAAGSALITVGGAVTRPGVYEIALGMPIGDLIQRAGGPSERPQAILAGGYFGGWLPYGMALDVPISGAALRSVGAALGPGVLILLPESACGLAETAWIAGYLAGQSAGQCGPCVNGLPALADMIGRLAFGRPDRRTYDWAQDLLGLVTRRGACHLPDGTASFVASSLRTFADELRQHSVAGPCARVRRRPVLPAPGHSWEALR
ncbi:MAG TPA: NADH-ubiquinone oxidoreductase-F iron-sulfur binding region domain-containing protein [Streptosporangiaceae bacterium]|nr:NADH-ubiquinone oxidoreductase-F iron-sulfur binding region domain-containing protein [Streptosporangiaceae bacterium]